MVVSRVELCHQILQSIRVQAIRGVIGIQSPIPCVEPSASTLGRAVSSPADGLVSSPTPTQATAKIPFFIVRHTGEIVRQTFWEEGRFGSKSLEKFLFSLATKLGRGSNDIESIKLVLRVKTREFVREMEDRSERSWRQAISTLKDEFRSAEAKGKGKLEGVSACGADDEEK